MLCELCANVTHPVFCAKREASLTLASTTSSQSPINSFLTPPGASAFPQPRPHGPQGYAPPAEVENIHIRPSAVLYVAEHPLIRRGASEPADSALTSTMLAGIDSVPIEVRQAIAAAGDLYLWGVHRHIQVAAFTVSIAEMIATLPDEIELIWPTKMSIMKFVYLVNKYSVLFDIAFMMFVDFTSRSSRACDTYFKLLTYWYITATLFSEAILLARSWALWACDRLMLYNTVFIACMMVPHTYYVAYDMLRINTANFAEKGLTIHLFGCMPAIDDQQVWPAFTYLICAETMIVLITLLKRYVDRSWLTTTGQQSYSNLMLCTLYRDGTCFWAIVLLFSTINMIMLFCAPRELSYSTQMGLRTVHSALCTRVLLNLRKVAARAAPTRREDELDFLTTLALEPLPEYSAETDESDESMPRTEDFELHDVARRV